MTSSKSLNPEKATYHMKSVCRWWRYTTSKSVIYSLATLLRKNILFSALSNVVLPYYFMFCHRFVFAILLFSLTFHTLGILSTAQQNGLAVPDASMYPVTSTSDVLELMDIGLQNRTVSSTALNERSSRSHRFSC